MRPYILNKVFSITFPIIVIALVSIALTPPQLAWQILLMLTFTLGYTHYFIGGYYQLTSFSRQSQYKRRMLAYWFLVAVSTFIIVFAQYWGLMWLVAFVTIPYFLLHGFFNEMSLARSVVGVSINPRFLAALSLYIAGLTMTAFSHYSAKFNYDLSFMAEPLYVSEQISLLIFLFKLAGGTFVFLATTVFMYEILINRRSVKYLVSAIGISLGALVLYISVYPFNYVYAFTFLLMYHFLTWMIHYGVRFKATNTSRFYFYVLAHVGIVALVIFIYSGFTYFNIQNPSAFVFNGNMFLFLTTVHITTAFLNDGWCKRLFRLD